MPSPRNKAGKPAGDVPELLELGAELAARRRTLGRLQQDVATAAGVSRSTLHTIEHGGAGVRWEKVAAVAETLGLRMIFEPLDGAEDGVGEGIGESGNWTGSVSHGHRRQV